MNIPSCFPCPNISYWGYYCPIPAGPPSGLQIHNYKKLDHIVLVIPNILFLIDFEVWVNKTLTCCLAHFKKAWQINDVNEGRVNDRPRPCPTAYWSHVKYMYMWLARFNTCKLSCSLWMNDYFQCHERRDKDTELHRRAGADSAALSAGRGWHFNFLRGNHVMRATFNFTAAPKEMTVGYCSYFIYNSQNTALFTIEWH